MRSFITKFIVAFLSFGIGVSGFYLSRVAFDVYKSETSSSPKELSGKIDIRFVRFVQEDSNIEAEFEVTNNRAEYIYYSGYSKNHIAFPTLKRDGKLVPDNRLTCGMGLSKQPLALGETVLIRVSKFEVTYEPASSEETDKPTQLGFSFIILESFIEIGERSTETVWTEPIKFPN